MTTRRPSHRGMAPQRRRKLVWATLNVDPNLAIAPQTQSFDIAGSIVAALGSVVGATLVRTHLHLDVNWTGGAVGDNLMMGIIIADRGRDVGAPPVSGMSCTANLNDDWMILQKFHPNTAGGGPGQEAYDLDLRAKRKFEEVGQTPVLFLQHITGAAALQTHVFMRALIALP